MVKMVRMTKEHQNDGHVESDEAGQDMQNVQDRQK